MRLIRNLLVATMLGATLSAGCTALTEKSPREMVSDATLVTRAKALLAADPVVKARNINVNVVKGDVTLTGIVKSLEEAERAIQLVRDLPGVNSVTSALRIESA
jgi:osmotically-inducible protein OsmY